MRKVDFTTNLPIELDCSSVTDLWAAICQAVPQAQRRNVAGYKLIRQETISGDPRHKSVTIQVAYR